MVADEHALRAFVVISSGGASVAAAAAAGVRVVCSPRGVQRQGAGAVMARASFDARKLGPARHAGDNCRQWPSSDGLVDRGRPARQGHTHCLGRTWGLNLWGATALVADEHTLRAAVVVSIAAVAARAAGADDVYHCLRGAGAGCVDIGHLAMANAAPTPAHGGSVLLVGPVPQPERRRGPTRL